MSSSAALAAAAARRIFSSSTTTSKQSMNILQNVDSRGMIAIRSFSSQGPPPPPGGGSGGRGSGGRGPGGRDGMEGRGPGGRGGRGPGGRGPGGRGGRGAGAYERLRDNRSNPPVGPGISGFGPNHTKHNPRQPGSSQPSGTRTKKPHRGGPKKENFVKKVLEPASRGDAPLPKLLARKQKSHAVHDETPETAKGREQTRNVVVEGGIIGSQSDLEAVEGLSDFYGSATTSDEEGGEVREGWKGRGRPLSSVHQGLYEEDSDEEEDRDLDEWSDDDPDFDPDNHPDIEKTEDGKYILYYDPQTVGNDLDEEGNPIRRIDKRLPPYEPDTSYHDLDGSRGRNLDFSGTAKRDMETGEIIPKDPEESFFCKDILDFTDPFPDIPDDLANTLLPLKERGPEIDDFMQAMIEHPTKYAEVVRENLHPESRREAWAIVPEGRVNPPEEFVTKHRRFLYVSGIRHPTFEENGVEVLGDFENPLHQHEVAEIIANMFQVKVTSVCAASMTSAFIGFDTTKDARAAEKANVRKRIQVFPIQMEPYENSEEEESSEETNKFIQSASSEESIIRLTNIPPGMEASQIASQLLPSGSDLASRYGTLEPSDVHLVSPTVALVKLSKGNSKSLSSDKEISSKLSDLGKMHVRVFRAEREWIHAGWGGPNRWAQHKKKGRQLIVSGDVPTPKFFLSHAGMVHLDNIPLDVTPMDIAIMAQPYSAVVRDVKGSVEFVKCCDGLPTGRCFVGFDRAGEAEAMVAGIEAGEEELCGSKSFVATLLSEKLLRRGKKVPPRPARTEEELLADLKGWRNYVNPKDLEMLEEHGIPTVAIDDAMIAVRYQNRSYAAIDQAIRTERLHPEFRPGEHYQIFVKNYIKLLKKNIASRENPGLLYEAMFGPGEEVELEPFDQEMERVKALRRDR